MFTRFRLVENSSLGVGREMGEKDGWVCDRRIVEVVLASLND